MEIKATHSSDAMIMLKASLGYAGDIPNEVTAHLERLLDYALIRLARTADIQLTPGDLYDDQLQVMYAAWLYRKGGEGSAKPPMLQEAIRDYQVAKATAEVSG